MNKITETIIEADPKVPVIRMARDFAATPGQLFRAHTDPALFARWVGPDAMTTRIEHWDARTGGSWRYVSVHDGTEYAFPGCSRSRWSTASRTATPGCAAAWTPASTRATPSWTGCSPTEGSEMAPAEKAPSETVLSAAPAERHRQIAGLFTERVHGTHSWDVPAPVDGWAARDVVRHLTEWLPAFLASGAGLELPHGPSVDED